jgi:hypothetical protein
MSARRLVGRNLGRSTFLLAHDGTGNDIAGDPRPYSASGLRTVSASAAAAALFGVRSDEPAHPDLGGLVQHGVVYTGGRSKIAEHGGGHVQDSNVPILVAGPDVPAPGVRDRRCAPRRSLRPSCGCSA